MHSLPVGNRVLGFVTFLESIVYIQYLQYFHLFSWTNVKLVSYPFLLSPRHPSLLLATTTHLSSGA